MIAEQQIVSICRRKGLDFSMDQLPALVILCTEFASIELESYISDRALKQCDDMRLDPDATRRIHEVDTRGEEHAP
jgi:hypothetical protein